MATIVDQNTWFSPWLYGSGSQTIANLTWTAQTVYPTSSYYMSQLDIPLYSYHSPTSPYTNYDVTVYVVGITGGGNPDMTNILWSETFSNELNTGPILFGSYTPGYRTFYPNVTVPSAGYAIVVANESGTNITFQPVRVGSDTVSTGKPKGKTSSDAGSTWADQYSTQLAFAAYTSDIPGLAYDPTPTDEGSEQLDGITFSWSIPGFAGYTHVNHKFYFREEGDSWSLLSTSTNATNNAVGLPVSYFSIGTTYEWKVEYEFDGLDVQEGTTWSFTIEYVELSGTGGGTSGGSGNFPVLLSGTSVSVGAAGTGAGTGSGTLTGSLDVSLPPSEINVTKTLYAIANSEFWYEDSANHMTELVAANGDMVMSDPLSSTAAFNKVFIANKSRLRVADFINIRLTSEAKISSNVPTHGQVLVQVTTGAKIVVDYLYYDTSASDHYIYGRQVGTVEFDTTNDVRDADTNVIISGANLSAVTASPHWYTWTEYNKGEDTSFLGMPDGAQLSCLYRGRIVLAGNPDDPYQWYMSRQANPWDWNYQEGDAQTAIAGGSGDMGKSGDVIKALIPWHDDYLILGCSKSMHVMRGDPASGGSLDAFDNTTGIFGPKSWCFDEGGNLYFYGTGGIYYAPRDIFVNGAGNIKNISKNALPNL